jgi:hypothetical protein
MRDANLFGGETRGISSWILEHSPLTEYVKRELREELSSPSISKAKRLEFLKILWVRTDDSAYLEQYFEIVKEPGGWEVVWGRRYLASKIARD